MRFSRIVCVIASVMFIIMMVGAHDARCHQKEAVQVYSLPAVACADMMGLDIRDAAFHKPLVISSASVVAADTTTGMPEYCKVVGAVGNNGFELRLPTSTWSGRFVVAGGGGNCGTITTGSADDLLKRGYATSGTNAGHDAALTGTTAKWGYDALYPDAYEREIDYGYRGVHVTTVAAKLLTKSFFNTPPKYAYFRGCSTGGRQGLMEAQRYPEDFDGIIAGDPPIGFTGLSVIFHGWPFWVNRDVTGQKVLTIGKLAMIKQAVMDACDGLDGVIDGVINDPRVCTWDPITSNPSIMCPKDVPASTCLTVAEANVVRKMYDAPRDTKGNIIYPSGHPRGTELDWSILVGTGTTWSFPCVGICGMAESNLQYIMFQPDPGPTYGLFDFPCTPNGCDRDAVAKLALYAPLYNATSPHLEKFKQRKGKMIMYAGWLGAPGDPFTKIDYYERVRRAMGKRDTEDFFRLYMIPGMGHCNMVLGIGPDDTDFAKMFPQLEDWVERGIAPREVVSTAKRSPVPTRTRLLCPYPNVAKYKGAGFDSDKAESYTCIYPDYAIPGNEWDYMVDSFPWDVPLDVSWWHRRH